jgi:hypothetical protein
VRLMAILRRFDEFRWAAQVSAGGPEQSGSYYRSTVGEEVRTTTERLLGCMHEHGEARQGNALAVQHTTD